MRTLILSLCVGLGLASTQQPAKQFGQAGGDCERQRIVRQRIIADAKTHQARGQSKALGLGVLAVGNDGSKTANLLAKNLDLSVYRIDLSKVVSKYIGETEKNLKTVFDEGAQKNAVLLLDEADALFSKRTEVKDSHDRYANQEIDYLFKQIEKFKGIVILTVKRKENIDPAFLRRLRFLVEPC